MTSTMYFKFRAMKAYETLLFDGHFLSVGELKQLIAEKRGLLGAAAELVLSEPPDGPEYNDDGHQIPKGSRVLVKRRSAQVSRVLTGATQPRQPLPSSSDQPVLASQTVDVSGRNLDDFGDDPFANAAAALQSEAAGVMASAAGPGPGSEKLSAWGLASRGGRAGGRGRGRGAPVPSDHYCKRCGETGKHFFWLCPTIDDPEYDPPKPMQRATGIPQTSLRRNADGSILLPTGEFGELVPNESAFQQQLAMMTGASAVGSSKPSLTKTPPRTPPHVATASHLALPAPTAVEVSTHQEPSKNGFTEVPSTGPNEPGTSMHQVKIETAAQKADVADATGAGAKHLPASLVEDLGGGLFDEDEPAAPTAPIIIRNTTAVAAADADFCLSTDDSILMSLLDAAMPPGVEDRHRTRAFGGTEPLSREDFGLLQKEILTHLLQNKKLADRFKNRAEDTAAVQRSDSASHKLYKERTEEGKGSRRERTRERERVEKKSRVRSRSRSRTRQEKRRQDRSPEIEVVQKKSPPSKRSVSPTSARNSRIAADTVQADFSKGVSVLEKINVDETDDIKELPEMEHCLQAEESLELMNETTREPDSLVKGNAAGDNHNRSLTNGLPGSRSSSRPSSRSTSPGQDALDGPHLQGLQEEATAPAARSDDSTHAVEEGSDGARNLVRGGKKSRKKKKKHSKDKKPKSERDRKKVRQRSRSRSLERRDSRKERLRSRSRSPDRRDRKKGRRGTSSPSPLRSKVEKKLSKRRSPAAAAEEVPGGAWQLLQRQSSRPRSLSPLRRAPALPRQQGGSFITDRPLAPVAREIEKERYVPEVSDDELGVGRKSSSASASFMIETLNGKRHKASVTDLGRVADAKGKGGTGEAGGRMFQAALHTVSERSRR
ncbi:hypothetical protein CEUSTIGMA_g6734.t1 [Chlamydomonas eustigma]|uniref:DWNN domain-containing protein n=1 Tax=Chlamydomonas eustigma TaxID=1157962 RepID=A0A250X891_9CHLO|nr:hypothetical protein CEUSTIGMA_g6734.t1 [Chlamydomonas eustigma]|eukprot:GAX79293.1 hypothetical protein CEUSTIGMA_g6734.t1 [Chlamydomonas eustigma]